MICKKIHPPAVAVPLMPWGASALGGSLPTYTPALKQVSKSVFDRRSIWGDRGYRQYKILMNDLGLLYIVKLILGKLTICGKLVEKLR
ncbi:MAG: hypothetical protein V7K89_26635 [Nostoc sp.]|uniref:hypothetical protein n=1 Tax=Nostoc sp. TaxID=1180 RepID=UPI002FF5D79F